MKTVIYPKGTPHARVVEALILSGNFSLSLELIEDTTSTVTDTLLIYDRPALEHKLEPQFEQKYEPQQRPPVYPYWY